MFIKLFETHNYKYAWRELLLANCDKRAEAYLHAYTQACRKPYFEGGQGRGFILNQNRGRNDSARWRSKETHRVNLLVWHRGPQRRHLAPSDCGLKTFRSRGPKPRFFPYTFTSRGSTCVWRGSSADACSPFKVLGVAR